MKAMAIHRHGTASELVRIDLPTPHPGPHEVRVRVVCSALNPADIRAREPAAQRQIARQFPLVLGYDVSGVVDSVGECVTSFAPGDAVFGSPALGGQGANAEFVCVDHGSLQPKPDILSHAEAAALSLAGTTALECLERGLAIAPARQVLVHAGAGGVGHLQLQIARALGLCAWATAGSAQTLRACAEFGAARAIDYRSEDFVAVCREATGGAGMPLVMDNVGGPVFERSLEALAPLGTLVSIVPTPVPVAQQLFLKAATLVYHVMGAASMWAIDPAAQGRALGRLVALVRHHGVRPHVGSRWPIRELAQAHRLIEYGRTIGKIVIDVEGGW